MLGCPSRLLPGRIKEPSSEHCPRQGWKALTNFLCEMRKRGVLVELVAIVDKLEEDPVLHPENKMGTAAFWTRDSQKNLNQEGGLSRGHMPQFEEKKWKEDYEKDGLHLDVEMELGGYDQAVEGC